MLSVLVDFSKQKRTEETEVSRPRNVSSVTISEGNTSGWFPIPTSTAGRMSRISTFHIIILGTNNGQNCVSMDSGLDEEFLRKCSKPLSVHSQDSDDEDMLSFHPGQQERLNLGTRYRLLTRGMLSVLAGTMPIRRKPGNRICWICLVKMHAYENLLLAKEFC